jgi:hypothetical protein
MVLYPGHPLVGRTVSVVRRYGRRERGQWIIELPDGSRQYIPISWCAPLSSFEERLLMPASSRDDPPSEGAAPSPLSLSTLRDLAIVVRRLQEEAAQRGEEQHNAGPGACEDPAQRSAIEQADATDVTGMGELPAGGSAPAGAHDSAGGAPPGGDTADKQPREEVSES